MRKTTGIVAVLLLAALAPAQEEIPETEGPEGAAHRVIAAFRAGDLETVREIAARPAPDPWIVADTICALGGHGAAVAFADHAVLPNPVDLLLYVEFLVENPEPPEVRRRLGSCYDAVHSGNDARAFETLGERGPVPFRGVSAVRAHAIRAGALERARKFDAAYRTNIRAAVLAESMGWWKEARDRYREAQRFAETLAEVEHAIAAGESGLRNAERFRERWGIIRAHIALVASELVGAGWDAAWEHLDRAEELLEGEGWDWERYLILRYRSQIMASTGDPLAALEPLREAARLAQTRGNESAVASCRLSMGNTWRLLGDYGRAEESYRIYLEYSEGKGDVWDRVRAHGVLANVLKQRKSLAAALRHYELAIDLSVGAGDEQGIGWLLNGLGSTYLDAGDVERAEAVFERAVELCGKRSRTLPSALCNLGIARCIAGKEEGLATLMRARAAADETGMASAGARIVCSLAAERLRRGEDDKAQALFVEARKLAAEIGDRELGGQVRLDLAGLALERAELEEAEALIQEAEAIAEETANPRIELLCAAPRVRLLLARGDREGVVRTAREYLRAASLRGAGLGEEHAASVRSASRFLVASGALSALARGDVEACLFFLESGRAGALLESLETRSALPDDALPEALAEAEVRARSGESRAVATLRAAMERGDREEIRAAREAVDDSRRERERVLERIQREAKAAANLSCPRPDDLATIRAHLAPEEALVAYGLFEEGALAVVVTRSEARAVDLGDAASLRRLHGDLRCDDPSFDPEGAAAALARASVAPLDLPENVTRVLVSPDAELAYAPFCLLFPDREVALVPSGTVLGLLRGEPATRGEAVLALGDPHYGEGPASEAVARVRSGFKLLPLPGSAEEARAVGDLVLLGKDASEAEFARTLATRPRWRAVHLACHGLVDPDHAMLSALALTPDGENDGFLTVMDVFRLRCPADLVVLSACETGKGKVYAAEGIMGLARAFMTAGSPRVLCSQWKVDDTATKALMVKFYELWDPAPDSDREPLPTATALKLAQDHVRSREEWRHPYYWAAWTLWGLP